MLKLVFSKEINHSIFVAVGHLGFAQKIAKLYKRNALIIIKIELLKGKVNLFIIKLLINLPQKLSKLGDIQTIVVAFVKFIKKFFQIYIIFFYSMLQFGQSMFGLFFNFMFIFKHRLKDVCSVFHLFLLLDTDIIGLQPFSKFIKVNDTIVVLVELVEDVLHFFLSEF